MNRFSAPSSYWQSNDFFEKDSFLNKIRIHSEITYPILVPAIEKQLKEWWHETLKCNFKDLKSILKELDKSTYEQVWKQYKCEVEVKINKRKELDSKWKLLEDRIKINNPEFISPELPYQPDTVLSDYYELHSQLQNN